MRKTIIRKTSWVFICFDEMMMMIYKLKKQKHTNNWFFVSTKSHTTTTIAEAATPQIIKCLTQMMTCIHASVLINQQNLFTEWFSCRHRVLGNGFFLNILSTVIPYTNFIVYWLYSVRAIERIVFLETNLYTFCKAFASKCVLWFHDFRHQKNKYKIHFYKSSLQKSDEYFWWNKMVVIE